jgi:hypothetical protein
MAEIRPVQIAGNMLAGYQGAQQIQSNQQTNQLRGMQLQQSQQQMQRDDEFRNQLGTYLQGGTNALAAMYQADPERAMQVQASQQKQNEFMRTQKVEQSKTAYAQAQGVINSEAPADYMRVLLPDITSKWAEQSGKPPEEMTDEDALSLANRVATIAGSQAGMLPEYTAPTAGQQDGRDVFFQADKTSGRTRVLPGVSPRPQKPLVEVNAQQKFESASEKAFGEAEGKAFSAIQELGQASQDQNSSLRAMMDNPAITGPTQDFRASANSFFSDLGVPISPQKVEQVANLGQYKAMQQSLVLAEQIKQKGPQTDGDRKVIQETFGNTKNIKESNELILKYKLAINDRNSVLSEIAERHRQDTGGIDGWRKTVRDYVNKTPLAAKDPDSKRLVFWNEFSEAMREDNPTMSEEDIMGYWRQRYGGK